jgi:hypothetical protein
VLASGDGSSKEVPLAPVGFGAEYGAIVRCRVARKPSAAYILQQPSLGSSSSLCEGRAAAGDVWLTIVYGRPLDAGRFGAVGAGPVGASLARCRQNDGVEAKAAAKVRCRIAGSPSTVYIQGMAERGL